MSAVRAQSTKSPWFGPAGGLPEILLFWALVSTVATYTTAAARREADAFAMACASLTALLLILSWRRCATWERAYSVILGAASICIFLLAPQSLASLSW